LGGVPGRRALAPDADRAGGLGRELRHFAAGGAPTGLSLLSKPCKGFKPGLIRRSETASVVTKLKASVEGSQYLIVLAIQVLPEVVRTPVRHFRPAPQSIATAGIGDRRREPSGAAGAGDQQPHAFSGAADAHGDVRHGDKPGIGNPHHIDAIDALKIRDR